jgi:copper homeostasis protein
MIEYALAYGVETHVLIRPRPGGFNYDRDEIEVVLRDIRECRSMGVNGIVVGVLNEANEINEFAMQQIMEQAEGISVTFHRAFDETLSFQRSIDLLIKLGVKRVLSSGMCNSVETGVPLLKQMVEYAANKIEIMAGGGINLANISMVAKEVQPNAIHFSATKKILLDEESNFSESILQVDETRAKRLLEIVRNSDPV